jgi:RNA polymerase subunit RPABC4/transcription elongation factor Spt4
LSDAVTAHAPARAETAGAAGGDQGNPRPEPGEACQACGAALAADQEWCLECGVARTAIQAPPDWRLGVAIVLAVVAIVVLITIIVWP